MSAANSSPPAAQGQPLWLELPPLSGTAPRRLLVFLHGAGSSVEAFAPVALAWQMKFPGASTAVIEALRPSASGTGRDWYDPAGPAEEHEERILEAATEIARRIAEVQRASGVDSAATVIIGFSQGATMAIELGRRTPAPASIVVAYAGRLARAVKPGESIEPTIHLIHGDLDSLVPAEQSERSFRRLRAAGADVSLDIAIDGTHTIGQHMVNLGTMRVLQTLFRGRARRRLALPPFPPPETMQ
jgi:phospholipase/carboxylesterase